jgi:hypothetical protein
MPQIAQRGCAQHRHGGREAEHVRELLLISLFTPELVVAVLHPPAAVHAGGLDMPERIRRDPDARPGWRDGQRADALQGRRVSDRAASDVEIGKRCPGPHAGKPGSARVAAVQARYGSWPGSVRHVATTSFPLHGGSHNPEATTVPSMERFRVLTLGCRRVRFLGCNFCGMPSASAS